MKIAVFGLGYVGSVTSVCLTAAGHEVWGVDEHQVKVDWINQGIPPIREPEFADRLKDALAAGRLRATSDARLAILNTDVALICVGTPTSATGATSLSALQSVIGGIAKVLKAEPHPYLVAVRSTIPPGIMASEVVPVLSSIPGARVCFNPEFLREGTAIPDFFAPPFTVLGIEAEDSVAASIVSDMEKVYSLKGVPTVRLNYKEAELVKVISNAYHALKINFANEVGSLASRVGADPLRLMEAFCLDTKLNISAKYLRPGFAFGGSCLPKDVRGLIHVAHERGLSLPVIEAILPSNQAHLDRARALIEAHPARVFGIAGIVFKADTDDVRESPAVALARALIDQGKEVLIYEPEIELSRLVGANLGFLEQHLPEYRKCIVDWETFRTRAEVIAFSRSGIVRDESALTQPKVRLYSLQGY